MSGMLLLELGAGFALFETCLSGVWTTQLPQHLDAWTTFVPRSLQVGGEAFGPLLCVYADGVESEFSFLIVLSVLVVHGVYCRCHHVMNRSLFFYSRSLLNNVHVCVLWMLRMNGVLLSTVSLFISPYPYPVDA